MVLLPLNIDRLLATIMPMRHKALITTKTSLLMILISWVPCMALILYDFISFSAGHTQIEYYGNFHRCEIEGRDTSIEQIILLILPFISVVLMYGVIAKTIVGTNRKCNRFLYISSGIILTNLITHTPSIVINIMSISMSYEASQILITTFYNSGITNPIIYFLAHPTARRHVQDMSMNLSMSRDPGNSETAGGMSFSQAVYIANRRKSAVVRHWKHISVDPGTCVRSPTSDRSFNSARSNSYDENCVGISADKSAVKFQMIVTANGRRRRTTRYSLEERSRRISPNDGKTVKENCRIISPIEGEKAKENGREVSPSIGETVKENSMKITSSNGDTINQNISEIFPTVGETAQQSGEVSFNGNLQVEDDIPIRDVQDNDNIAQVVGFYELEGVVLEENLEGEEDAEIVLEGVMQDICKPE
ncbi:hypothetical protein ACHWQZ_G006925 [Mnemiopsis leidyi]